MEGQEQGCMHFRRMCSSRKKKKRTPYTMETRIQDSVFFLWEHIIFVFVFHLFILVYAEISVCPFALSIFKALSSSVCGASLSWVMSNIPKLFYIHFFMVFKSGWVLTQWNPPGPRGSSLLPVCHFFYGLPLVYDGI